MNVWQQFFDSPLIERLGWTLVHSLWQGAAAGLLLAIVLAALRHRPANVRYLVSCMALFTITLLPIGTFVLLEGVGEHPVHTQTEGTVAEAAAAPGKQEGVEKGRMDDAAEGRSNAITGIDVLDPVEMEVLASPSLVQQFPLLLRGTLPWAVAGWLAGVTLLSIQLFAGWRRVLRLRTTEAQPVAREWLDRCLRLAVRLGIPKTIAFRESSLVDTPLVIGWLKPVILIPASALTGLSPQQIEGLLAHELAHIRRHDYLVNLLQSGVETVLFYHPVVWWISKRIQIERENACDDVAAQVCGDRIAYARALAGMEELRSAPVRLAVAARGGVLIPRIRRLAGLPEQGRSSAGWITGFAMLLAVALTGYQIDTHATAVDPTETTPEQPAALIRFRVLDELTGQPLEGAQVTFREDRTDQEYTTGADGLCHLKLKAARPRHISVRAEKSGSVPKRVSWSFEQPSFPVPSAFTMELEPVTTIGGVVRNEKGEPVEGVVLLISVRGSGLGNAEEIHNDLWERRVTTNHEGKWQFHEAPRDLTRLSIQMLHPSYIQEFFPRTAADTDERFRQGAVEMTIRRGIQIKGLVTDQAGKPIAGAEILPGKDRSFSNSMPSFKTDADGQFMMTSVRLTGEVLTVVADGYSPEIVRVSPTGELPMQPIRLTRGNVLRGRVVDADGNPLPGVRVSVSRWREQRSLSIRLQTDSQGRFEWTSAPEDPVTFTFLKKGYRTLADQQLAAGDQEHPIVLRKPFAVIGSVKDAKTAAPVGDFRIVKGARRPDGRIYWEWDKAVVAHAGQFEWLSTSTLKPDREHILRIEAEGYLPLSQIIRESGDEQVMDVQLLRGAPFRIRVLQPDGQPASEAQVQVVSGNLARLMDGEMVQELGNLMLTTDEAGVFSILPQDGSYALVVTHPNGFAFCPGDKLSSTSELRLEAWGSVVINDRSMWILNYENAVRIPDFSNWFEVRVTTPPVGVEYTVLVKVPPGQVSLKRLTSTGWITDASVKIPSNGTLQFTPMSRAQ